jgi:hypothetical protein
MTMTREPAARAMPKGARSTPGGARSTPEGTRSTPDETRSTPEGARSTRDGLRSAPDGARFVVVHPLDDLAEAKVAVESLGPMRLTRGARLALLSLRLYLLLMTALLVVHLVFQR